MTSSSENSAPSSNSFDNSMLQGAIQCPHGPLQARVAHEDVSMSDTTVLKLTNPSLTSSHATDLTPTYRNIQNIPHACIMPGTVVVAIVARMRNYSSHPAPQSQLETLCKPPTFADAVSPILAGLLTRSRPCALDSLSGRKSADKSHAICCFFFYCCGASVDALTVVITN